MTTSTCCSAPRHATSGRWILAILAAVFGVATLVEGMPIVAGDAAARAAAGDYVPFVVAFNVVAAFAYLVAAAGFAARRVWAPRLAGAIAVASLVAFAAFAVHVALGGAYLPRTFAAMTLRVGFWLAAARIGRRLLSAG